MSWADVVARAKALRPPGPSRRGRRRLTVEQVLEIRAVHIKRHPLCGASALARRFGLDSSSVTAVLRRDSYAWIPPLKELGHG